MADQIKPFYASEIYGQYAVFTRAGYQIGGTWPSMKLAEQAADLACLASLNQKESTR